MRIGRGKPQNWPNFANRRPRRCRLSRHCRNYLYKYARIRLKYLSGAHVGRIFTYRKYRIQIFTINVNPTKLTRRPRAIFAKINSITIKKRKKKNKFDIMYRLFYIFFSFGPFSIVKTVKNLNEVYRRGSICVFIFDSLRDLASERTRSTLKKDSSYDSNRKKKKQLYGTVRNYELIYVPTCVWANCGQKTSRERWFAYILLWSRESVRKKN